MKNRKEIVETQIINHEIKVHIIGLDFVYKALERNPTNIGPASVNKINKDALEKKKAEIKAAQRKRKGNGNESL